MLTSLLLLATALAAPELCNGVDDNGDGRVDEGPVWAAVDADGDGFGDPATAVLVTACRELGPDEVSDASDLDENDADRHPGAAEACNALDDDGDGIIDEGCDCDAYLVDADVYTVCTTPMSWFEAEAACDARGYHLATVHNAAQQQGLDDLIDGYGIDFWIGLHDQTTEGAFVWVAGGAFAYDHFRAGEPNDYNGNEDCVEAEAGTGLWDDQNCAAPEAFVCEVNCVATLWFADVDGDGLGDPDSAIEACAAPADHVRNAADCDDGDDTFPRLGWFDLDQDGFGDGLPYVTCDADLATVDGDCDDEDPMVSPGSPELPDDGIDSDCDGSDLSYTEPGTDTGVEPTPEDTGATGGGRPQGGHGSGVPEASGSTDDGEGSSGDHRAATEPGDAPDYGFGLGCASVPARTMGLLALLLLPVVRRRG